MWRAYKRIVAKFTLTKSSCFRQLTFPLKRKMPAYKGANSMNFMSQTRCLVIVCLLSVIALSVIGVKAIKSQQGKTKLPVIISKSKNLEVVGVTILNEGEPHAAVALEVRNNSDKAVIAVAIVSGDDKDASGITTNGFPEGDDPPFIVMEPYGTRTFEMPLSNLLPGKPLKIGGVAYADGTEEGDKMTLETMHGQKERSKAVKKGDSSQP